MLSQCLITVSLDRIHLKNVLNFKKNYIAVKEEKSETKIESNFFDEAVSLIYKIIKNNG